MCLIERLLEGRINGLHFAIDVASSVKNRIQVEIGVIRENFVKFFPDQLDDVIK